MDSRYDFILLNEKLTNGRGFDSIGHPTTPYSTVTWNDPAHSDRAWGKDGTSFNNPLTIAGNTQFKSITVTAVPKGGTFVAAPTITGDSPFLGTTTVTLSGAE